jgi:hypothetical protein
MNAQSITNLAYESINDKYSRAKYGEFNVIMDMTNGYINATKLCADGDKLMKNWLRNDNNKELIAEFEKNQLNNEPVLFTSDSYGITRGSYVHPLLIPHIASWVSPSFARKVSVIVNNYMIREKDDEIRRLTGDNIDLKKMFQDAENRRIEENRKCDEENRQRDEENKKMLQKMIEQNQKTHAKLDKADNANEELQNTLDVVVTRLETVAEEIVKPSKRLEVHEQFVVMKLNNPKSDYSFKVFCSQNRNVAKAKNNVLREHCDATVFLEITPSPNSKNFLHNLKDLYDTKNNDAKLNIRYNYISLVNGTLENELCDMVNKVVEDAKNLGMV